MKKFTLKSLLLIFIFIVVIAGCAVIPPINPVVEPAHSGFTFFADDFSTPPNGWGTMGREGGEILFEYEGLVLKVITPNSLIWSINQPRYSDTRIDVDAVLLDGPVNDNFGVICRFLDNENFYGFLVTHDGYYGIFKMLNGEMVMPGTKANLDFNEVIRQGGVVNHITAECSGKILRLTVNDTLVAEIQDNSFSEGQVGLIAGAYENAGVKVLFDNFKVTQP
jgi:hypothetical protein